MDLGVGDHKIAARPTHRVSRSRISARWLVALARNGVEFRTYKVTATDIEFLARKRPSGASDEAGVT
jgi:hypothetical protein